MDESVKKAEAMLQQARQDAERTRQQMVEEARAESTRIVEQGMKRIEAEQRAAMQEIRKVAGDLAIQAAGRLLQSSLTEPQQRQIVDKFLSEVPEKTIQ
jgi:F-type H+-transporting ATPase subunit b